MGSEDEWSREFDRNIKLVSGRVSTPIDFSIYPLLSRVVAAAAAAGTNF